MSVISGIFVSSSASSGPGGIDVNDISTFIAGEALTRYDVVYINSSDRKLYIADGDIEAKADAMAIVTEDLGIAQDAQGTVQLSGFVTNSSWTWTAGDKLWLSTVGTLTTDASALEFSKPLGVATSATEILFYPETGWSNNVWFSLAADQLALDYIPTEYTRTITPDCTATNQITAHLKGINDELASIKAQL